ncbi:GPI inositol-deacylase PGAP1-like protein, partial [Kockovaella imperatae]
PVIFVPGNAGSYAQVRSIASSASRQYHEHPGQIAQGMQHVRGRDFFTVDYNEEFSAFHGPTVRDQAHYLAYAVRKVLELYRDHSGPSQVTLLGHSMGGIVARLAAIEVSDLVDVIFTMSTPHLYPPVALEWSMESIYNTINSQSHHGSGPVLLSICGGVSDTQIVSDACSLTHDLVGKDGGFAVFTTGIPGAWTGVDHQAMVWCHQVRWRVAR